MHQCIHTPKPPLKLVVSCTSKQNVSRTMVNENKRKCRQMVYDTPKKYRHVLDYLFPGACKNVCSSHVWIENVRLLCNCQSPHTQLNRMKQ